jgi:hypothetical protein
MDIVNSNSNDCSLIAFAALRQAAFCRVSAKGVKAAATVESDAAKLRRWKEIQPSGKLHDLFKLLIFMYYFHNRKFCC